jgi:cysteinyl-tRNA synthetase
VQIYNTMTREIDPVETNHPDLARIYACGPTVYRDAHVGNMRTFLVTDLIARTLRYEGYRTIVVQNITDVGHMADDTGLGDGDESLPGSQDKMLAESEKTGRSALDIAQHFERAFHQDLARLNIYPADHYPKASESIESMLTLIQKLIDSGNAYIGSDNSVYFSAESFPSYGALSGNRLDALRPGHKFDADENESAKRFHADWALWKSAGENRTQLTWETPWGRGFPGWHTECSAMSLDLLGENIDIHTGGIDLRFPHHEDERAQSNSATSGEGKSSDHEVVRHWVHAEHLLFETRKMSKSSGNVVLVQDVIDRGYDPLALRLAFMQHKYRSQMNLTWEVIESSQELLNRWRHKVNIWSQSNSQAMDQAIVDEISGYFSQDLNTPMAVNALRNLEKNSEISDGAKFEIFAHLDSLFGLDLARDVGKDLNPTVQIPTEVSELLDQRNAARSAKDWALSDELRDRIAGYGFTIVDTSDGAHLEPIKN